MKISITLSIIILAIVGLLGSRATSQLAEAREKQGDLIAKASSVGIVINPSDPTHHRVIPINRRGDREGKAREMVADLISSIKKMKAFMSEMEEMEVLMMEMKAAAEQRNELLDEAKWKAKGREMWREMDDRSLAVMEGLMALDSTGMKMFISEIRSNNDFTEDTRKELLGLTISALANSRPQSALALYLEFPEALSGPDELYTCLLYTSPSPRDGLLSRMPSSA